MSPSSISEISETLNQDLFRAAIGFDPEFDQASIALFQAKDDGERSKLIGKWITKNQPCIFGRLAAERELISFCFLTERDLQSSDEEIREKIQIERNKWKTLALDGRRNAFVILAISKDLALARPDDRLQAFACRLATLYLDQTIEPDQIYHDRVRLWDLEYKTRRRWLVGVNVFAAQGDRRWWNDHRMPGGLGFSMNSVGHLVASEVRRSAIRKAAEDIDAQMPGRAGKLRKAEASLVTLQQTSVRTLEDGLRFAMYTILNASEISSHPSGYGWDRATFLLRSDPGTTCPAKSIAEDARLQGMSIREYAGWYHTDVTVPSEYFRPDLQRPSDVKNPFVLDLSYLHSGRGEDYRKVSRGEPV